MSTAKERYYEFKSIADKCFEGLRDPLHEYVTELEQEKAELLSALENAYAIMAGFGYKSEVSADLLKKHGVEI